MAAAKLAMANMRQSKGREFWLAFDDMVACEVGKRVFSTLKTDSRVVLLEALN
jgi:hypothetical protein